MLASTIEMTEAAVTLPGRLSGSPYVEYGCGGGA